MSQIAPWWCSPAQHRRLSPAGRGFKSRPGRQLIGFDAYCVKRGSSSAVGLRRDIHGYGLRVERLRRVIAGLRNGELALAFLDHLEALGLSEGRIHKYASQLPTLLRRMDKPVAELTRRDVEEVHAPGRVQGAQARGWGA